MNSSPFKIIVPVDFTEASDTAVAQASLLNETLHVNLELLHIVHDEEHSKEDFLLEKIAESLSEKGIVAYPRVVKGDVIPAINETAKEGNFDLMVIGTHGSKGIRQNLFGADILKLLKGNSCPSIVVQKTSKPVDHFEKILLPVGSHAEFNSLVISISHIAKASNAEVIIYCINRPLEETSEDLNVNKQNAKQLFLEMGINFLEVSEPSSVISFGFAKQTLIYAENNGIDLIGIMAHASSEHSYFANADKERMLMNEKGIAILCSAGA
jgi:nucleotide-binding universal stress UspA family protein